VLFIHHNDVTKVEKVNNYCMDLREAILKEHSKANALQIAGWIGTDSLRLNALMQLFLGDEYRVVQRAAHILGIIGERQPEMLQPHLPEMLQRMQEGGQPVAVKRNVVRLLQYRDIPEALHGEVMNICFELLADVQETVAVRAFSMTVLAKLATIYPDLKQELRVLIEDGLANNPSPGFKSRGAKVLAGL
jgi:hypothetical protein